MLTSLPAIVAVTAVVLTYLVCIRPLRRGTPCSHLMPPQREQRAPELERLRTELDLLRLREQQRQRAYAG